MINLKRKGNALLSADVARRKEIPMNKRIAKKVLTSGSKSYNTTIIRRARQSVRDNRSWFNGKGIYLYPKYVQELDG